MPVHLLQLDIRWEDPAANRARVAEMVRGSAIAPGDLLLLPEMFDTGFSFNTAKTADRSGESRAFIVALAKERSITVVAGITVEADDGIRNRAIVAGPRGEIVAQYDKRRLFPLGSPSEAERLTAGDAVAMFEWSGMKVCPLICYDLRFPELFGEGLRAGAEAFALIANWPAVRFGHWRTLLIARAIENQAFVFAVNRVGKDGGGLDHGGGSMVIDPLGNVLYEADSLEQVASAAPNPQDLVAWRAKFPAWKARAGLPETKKRSNP